MRKHVCAVLFGAAALGFGAEAKAWGLHNGENLHPGDNMVYGELGWPGLWSGFQHGVSNSFDVGARLDLDWGYPYEYYFGGCGAFGRGCGFYSPFGIDLRAVMRFQIARGAKVSANFHLNPGLAFTFWPGDAEIGLTVPIGAEIGIHINHQVTVDVEIDSPLDFAFSTPVTRQAYFLLPILVGPGFQYTFKDRFGPTATLELGPAIPIGGICVGCGVVLDVQFMGGFFYRF